MAKKGERGSVRGAGVFLGDYERALMQEEARIRKRQQECVHPEEKCEVICMCCGFHKHIVGGRVYKRHMRVRI